MSLSYTKTTCILCFVIISSLGFGNHLAQAGDFGFLKRITPHVSLKKNEPSQEIYSFSLAKKHSTEGYSTPVIEGQRVSPEDIFSLGLGAHFKISEWLDVGAACSLPFIEEEAIDRKDMSVEAMVTMQF